MPGVHRLEHVERFATATLADDDSIGSHTKCVLDEVALNDLALALDVRGTCLEAHPVLVLDLQLGWVLDSHDLLVARDVAGQQVQQRRLACAGTTRDKNGGTGAHTCAQAIERRSTERAETYKVVGGQ